MTITKIMAGGEKGADRGGLDAAIYCNIPYGGWCPKGRRAEGGTIPDQYQLKEHPSPDYTAWMEANISGSDAVVMLAKYEAWKQSP